MTLLADGGSAVVRVLERDDVGGLGRGGANVVRVFLVVMLYLSWSVGALAYVDCIRPIQAVWSGHDPNRIYVTYRDGFAPAGMQLNDVGNDEKVVDRALAVILSGYLSGKALTFRYVGGVDGSPPSCTPAVPQRLLGAWVS